MKLRTLLTSMLFVTASVSANAGGYIGFGGGLTNSNAGNKITKFFEYDSGASKDSTATGITIYAGYKFNSYFSIESNYTNFGTYEVKGTISGDDSGDKVRAKAYALSAIGSWPITDNFGLDGKLGLGSMTQKYTCITLSCNYLPSTNKTSTVTVFGVGAYWQIAPHWALRGRYELYSGGKFAIKDATGDTYTEKANYGLLFFGAEWDF